VKRNATVKGLRTVMRRFVDDFCVWWMMRALSNFYIRLTNNATGLVFLGGESSCVSIVRLGVPLVMTPSRHSKSFSAGNFESPCISNYTAYFPGIPTLPRSN